MKPSASKSKGPRVLANTVKKLDKSSSGNKSFFNKSTNHYVNDLRNNNAKLAHSLASEKRKMAEIFRRYNESQNELLREQACLRAVSDQVHTGITLLNDAVDLLLQSTKSFADVHSLLKHVRPQSGGSTAAVSHVSAAPATSQENQEAAQISFPGTSAPVQLSASVQASCQQGNESRATTSIVRQCMARPMIKGQVISNPTISLQRVAVPTRCHLGKGKVKPARGVLLDYNGRLSEIAEQMNESSESRSSLARVEANSDLTLGPCANSSLLNTSSSISLPPTHDVLKCRSPKTAPSEIQDIDEGQHTVVHFGRFSYSEGAASDELLSHLESFTQARTADTVLISSESSISCADPVKPILENSDEFESGSSSEDENLALRIAESRKSFMKSIRQTEFKEGTSWNYDEKGKFHKRPPNKRKYTKAANRPGRHQVGPDTISGQAMKSKAADLNKSHDPDMKLLSHHNNVTGVGKTPPKQKSSLTSTLSPKIAVNLACDSSNSVPNQGNSATADPTSPNLLDFSTTNTEAVDMSFTCVSPPQQDLISHLHQQLVKSPSPQRCSDIVQLEDRQAYITQRPRSRKAPSQKPDASLSPVLTLLNSSASLSGARDQNPSPQLSSNDQHVKVSVSSDHLELTRKPSFVLLERLPSKYCGNNYSVSLNPQRKPKSASCSNHEGVLSPSKKSKSPNHVDIVRPKKKTESLVSSNQYYISPQRKPVSPAENGESDSSELSESEVPLKRRKRILKIQSSSSADDDDSDRTYKPPGQIKAKPRTRKKSKGKRQDLKSSRVSKDERLSDNAQSLSPTSPDKFSAPTSSIAVSENLPASEVAQSSDVAGHHRPKRNAAPLKLKEPSLTGKLRQP